MVHKPKITANIRAVTVADFYHRGGNGPTTAGGTVLWYIYIYIILKRKKIINEARSSINKRACLF